MVLILLGTWEAPFTRPLVEIEAAVKEGLITEEVIVQSGATPYESKLLSLTPYFSSRDLEELSSQASYVICQAGVGSIMMGLRRGKKVIAIPRLQEQNEHIDNHQLEILHVFSKKGYILPWQNESLPVVLARLDSFTPAPYPFADERISDAILNFLNKK